MKRIKRKIKKCKSKFWDSNLNPITMWKVPKKLGDSILEETELFKKDQMTIFKNLII